MGQQVFSDESLGTFMTEVEKILNSRPITFLSSDVRDPHPLSPNMILLMRSNESVSPGLFCKNDNYPRRWWKQIHYLSNIFWSRWIKEYLPTLQVRQKWQAKRNNLNKGDLVLVLGTPTHRGVWPLGIIKKVIKGSDGLVRSCIVQMNKSEIKRPITLLCKLEVSN